MALNADVLGALMKANIDALTDEQKADRVATFKALASAIIAHIQSAGVVAVVTTCGAGAGTGTGAVT
jgi:hypothetical protein